MSQSHSVSRSVPTFVVTVAGCLLLCLGFVVQIGWHTQNPLLISVRPEFAPSQFNSSLCLILIGSAFFAFILEARRLAVVLAVLPLAIALITLLEYAFGSDLKVDRLLYDTLARGDGIQPGRMSQHAATSFLLTAFSILVLASRKKRPGLPTGTLAVLSCGVLALGAISTLGYLTGIPSFSWANYNRMALLTSLGVMGSGIGTLALCWREEKGKILGAPKWLPIAVGLGVLTGAFCLWQGMAANEEYLRTAGSSGHAWTQSLYPELTLVMGMAIAALWAMTIHFALRAQWRARQTEDALIELKAVNAALEKSEEEFRRLAEALKRSQEGLEHEVADRTAEILSANKALRGEIAERARLEKLKDEFVGIASHEIRKPLGIVKFGLENLKSGAYGELTGEQAEAIGMACEKIRYLNKVIGNFLDLARLESGKAHIDLGRVKMRDVLERARDDHALLVHDKSIRLAVEAPENLPDAYTDRDLIVEILDNLLDNAVRFAAREVLIRAAETSEAGRPCLAVSVSDDGPGIPPENREDVFDKYVQIRRNRGNDYRGTGLGLAICREIVARLGGRIWIESAHLGGACVTFTLPLDDARPDRGPDAGN